MDIVWQDLRYAVRSLVADPTFSVAAVLMLAIGLGGTSAIFSVCQTVLLKPLPYSHPDRIVMVWEQPEGRTPQGFAPANFVDVRTRSTSFEHLAAINPSPEFTVTGSAGPERLAGAAVSVDFLRVFGTEMALGRDFLPAEDQPGRNLVAILTDQLWQRRFGSDPAIVGQSITLSGNSYEIVGVLPRDFQLVSHASDFGGRNDFDIWIPLALNMHRLQRGTHPLRVLGRLRAGRSQSAAQAELDSIARELQLAHPSTNANRDMHLVSLSEQTVANVRVPLLTLLGAVLVVWLIGCVNVANLMLVRASGRRHEMAVRIALGANRARLARQLVTEAGILTCTATIVGAALGWAAMTVLIPELPFDLPRSKEIGLTVEVFALIAVASFLTALVFGCAPMLQRAEASESLKDRRSTMARGQRHARNVTVVAQMALACVLLVGAGLMGRSLWQLLSVPAGFRAEHVLSAQISLIPLRYPDVTRIAAFQRDLLERVARLPGVERAGMAGYLPLGGSDNSWTPSIEHKPPLPRGEHIQYRPITVGYIEVMGIPLRSGRLFTDSDRSSSPLVAIINEAAARRYWPNENPIGQRVQIDGASAPWRTVVGIIGDVRHAGLDEGAAPELYLPFGQIPYPNSTMTLVIRTAGDPVPYTAAVRRALGELDPAIPLSRVATMNEVVTGSLGEPRFRALLVGAFACMGLALAAIGIYGVVSYLVSQRTREFGIRAAVGATKGDLLRLVLGHSSMLIAVGLAIGMLGSFALARVVRTVLFGVTPYDAVTFGGAAALAGAVGLIASYVPARRATQIDPWRAIRTD
jgi:putative ABC transport system permease protein